MATIDAVTPRPYAALPRRGPITRLLEDERWLASVLLLPTIVLLGLFIAYPFVKGVLLAVTDTKVGVPGPFRRPREFREAVERQHLPRRGLQHLSLHLRHDGLQAGARPLAGAAAEPAFPGQGVRARLHPAAVHHPDGAVDLRLEVDVRPDLQRPELDAVPARH